MAEKIIMPPAAGQDQLLRLKRQNRSGLSNRGRCEMGQQARTVRQAEARKMLSHKSIKRLPIQGFGVWGCFRGNPIA